MKFYISAMRKINCYTKLPQIIENVQLTLIKYIILDGSYFQREYNRKFYNNGCGINSTNESG